jgi:processing peptidase subunit alpha
MSTLLGGGSSFSAGGPGKGMYSRLYLQVLNRHYWVESARAFPVMYDSTGLFYIYGTAEPSNAHDLVSVMMDQVGD